MCRARDSGKTTATARIILFGKQADESGILLFAPVFRSPNANQTVEQRRANLVGFVAMAFHVPNLIESALAILTPVPIDVQYYDVGDDGMAELLHTHASQAARTPPLLPASQLMDTVSGLRITTEIPIAGRRWLAYSINTHPSDLAPTWHDWGALLSGLLLTAILGSYLVIMRRHANERERSCARWSASIWLWKPKSSPENKPRKRPANPRNSSTPSSKTPP